MKKQYSRLRANQVFTALLLIVLFACTKQVNAQISITTSGSPLTEDFNMLASTGTSSTVPAGGRFLKQVQVLILHTLGQVQERQVIATVLVQLRLLTAHLVDFNQEI